MNATVRADSATTTTTTTTVLLKALAATRNNKRARKRREMTGRQDGPTTLDRVSQAERALD